MGKSYDTITGGMPMLSNLLMGHWHRQVTGYWYHPEQDAAGYTPEPALERFLTEGEKPIFVAFGKAESKQLAELEVRTVEALKETGVKAVVQAIETYGAASGKE